MPRRTLEQTLDELSRLRREADSETLTSELRRALKSKNCFVVARAAEIAGERGLAALAEDLVRAFDTFCVDPLETDKGCRAKTAIADALFRLEYDAEGIFLRGIRHVQLEPVWGGRQDTAVELRGISASGLVQTGYADVLSELAHLLADDAAPARAAALRALGYVPREGVVPLLRYKALIGDDDPLVQSECFSALLGQDPEASLPFVAEFLDRGRFQEVAAIALGASRRIEALELLEGWFERQFDSARRRTGLIAIATLRRDEAFHYLFELIASAEPPIATLAASAFEMYFEDERIRERVRESVEKRGDLELPVELRRALEG